jgi:bacterioferritin-associated ferredoxin
MIVCICNNISTKDVKKSVEKGRTKPVDVMLYNNCEFKCGCCAKEIKRILKGCKYE